MFSCCAGIFLSAAQRLFASVREAPSWRQVVPRSLSISLGLGKSIFCWRRAFTQVLLRSHRRSGPHFLCREKVTKSGRGARAEGLLRKARPFGAGRPSRGDQSPHVPPCPPGGSQFAQRSGANCEPAGATPPPVSLWLLSSDEESNIMRRCASSGTKIDRGATFQKSVPQR